MQQDAKPSRYRDRVRARTRLAGNIVCVGLDPVPERIPFQGPPADRIRRFYEEMLSSMSRHGLLPAAVKPNMAYYEALDLASLSALREITTNFRGEGVLVVLDAKRGDIAASSGAYARMAFSVYAADAVTVAPYMGHDSVKPFLENGAGGAYLLVRTSNPGARDFQDLVVRTEEGERPLYMEVAARLLAWDNGNLGAVVGATAPRELEALLRFWKRQGGDVPTLIPGVAVGGVSGGQSGSAGDVAKAIRNAGSDFNLHLVNSSSGINYAYEKYPRLSPGEASVKALEELAEALSREG